MSGRVALVTGAGRGIGLAIAKAFAGAGAAVAIQDIDLQVAENAAAEIRREGGRAIALAGDISDLKLPGRAVAQAASELGGLHIMVNNASVQSSGDWMNVQSETIERELRADLVSPILFCQEAVKIFRPQKSGRILNIGSIQQQRGNARMLAYSLSKAALGSLTTALARELAGDGITVNQLAPGWFNTYRNRSDFAEAGSLEAKGQRAVPLGRIGEPADCVGTALLLCSDAGAYITGQTIYVDGGMSAR